MTNTTLANVMVTVFGSYVTSTFIVKIALIYFGVKLLDKLIFKIIPGWYKKVRDKKNANNKED